MKKRLSLKRTPTVRRSLTRNVDNKWSWNIYVWREPGIFAHFIAKSTVSFDTKKKAVEDMNKNIDFMGLTEFVEKHTHENPRKSR